MEVTPERIAELRRRYAGLEAMMSHVETWDRDQMLGAVREAFGGAKIVPQLLDEIERLQRVTQPPAGGSGEA